MDVLNMNFFNKCLFLQQTSLIVEEVQANHLFLLLYYNTNFLLMLLQCQIPYKDG